MQCGTPSLTVLVMLILLRPARLSSRLRVAACTPCQSLHPKISTEQLVEAADLSSALQRSGHRKNQVCVCAARSRAEGGDSGRLESKPCAEGTAPEQIVSSGANSAASSRSSVQISTGAESGERRTLQVAFTCDRCGATSKRPCSWAQAVACFSTHLCRSYRGVVAWYYQCY